MELNRTKNAKRNIFWGIINKFIRIGFPFVIRTVIIYKLGINYVGLNSLFTAILSTLSLAELGFDTAIVTVMYKSVAQNDDNSICALLAFIKKAYFIVGLVILIMGSCCIPFLQYLVKDLSKVPSDINIKILFIMFLTNTVVSYFFGGYRKCILEAYQRQDLVSNVNSTITIVFSLIEILVLACFENYYFYVFVLILSSVCINVSTYAITKKRFSDITPKGVIENEHKESLKKILVGTFLGRVGAVLSVSFDNIIISSFLGLPILSYYSNYAYIITALQGFLVIAYTSIQAGIGNSLVLESEEKNFQDMLNFSFIYNWAVGWCSICLLYLFQPFIFVWIGEEGVLPIIVVCLIVLDFYIVLCCGIQGTYKNALGIWWEDRYRCLIGGIVNLILNVTMVFLLRRVNEYIALAGVVTSTIIADLLVLTPWSIKVTFDKFYKKGMKTFVMHLIAFFVCTIINIFICYMPMSLIANYFIKNKLLIIVFRMIVLLILPNIFYYIVFRSTKQFKNAYIFVKKVIRKRGD